jgi:hypothetical protein
MTNKLTPEQRAITDDLEEVEVDLDDYRLPGRARGRTMTP